MFKVSASSPTNQHSPSFLPFCILKQKPSFQLLLWFIVFKLFQILFQAEKFFSLSRHKWWTAVEVENWLEIPPASHFEKSDPSDFRSVDKVVEWKCCPPEYWSIEWDPTAWSHENGQILWGRSCCKSKNLGQKVLVQISAPVRSFHHGVSVKSTLLLMICKHYFNSCVRCAVWLFICFTCMRCTMSLINLKIHQGGGELLKRSWINGSQSKSVKVDVKLLTAWTWAR